MMIARTSARHSCADVVPSRARVVDVLTIVLSPARIALGVPIVVRAIGGLPIGTPLIGTM